MDLKLQEKRKPPDGGKGGRALLKKLITLHAIAAAATTIIYTWMTKGDWAYIFAMMALYNWVLGTAAIVQDIWNDRKVRHHGRIKERISCK